jgi:hypothetical protein
MKSGAGFWSAEQKLELEREREREREMSCEGRRRTEQRKEKCSHVGVPTSPPPSTERRA